MENSHVLSQEAQRILGAMASAECQALVRVQQIQTTAQAFAAILDGGSVLTWSDPYYGGDSSHVQLTRVKQLGELLRPSYDGSAVAWGDPRQQEQLVQVRQIQATNHAFAAVTDDGSVVTWGDAEYGGDGSAIQTLWSCLLHIFLQESAMQQREQDAFLKHGTE